MAYGSDLALVKKILAEAPLVSEHVDRDRAPVAVVTRFGELAIQCRVVFHAKDYTLQSRALSDVHEEVYRRFRDAGIEIPFLVRTAGPEEVHKS